MSIRLYEDYYNAIKDKLPSIMKFKKSDKKSDREKVEPICIQISLKEGKEETPLTQEFVNVLQHEYAVRYLEVMGVIPTQNMINSIKKKIPLRNCEIKAGWSHQGWLADTVKIYPQGIKEQKKQVILDDEKKESHVKKKLDVLNKAPKHVEKQSFQEDSNEPQEKPLLDLETVQKYIFPFNKSYLDDKLYSDFTPDQMLRLYRFPFESQALQLAHLKEIQDPIKTMPEDILYYLQRLKQDFPTKSFHLPEELPASLGKKRVGAYQNRITVQELKTALDESGTPEVARLIGLFSHLCY